MIGFEERQQETKELWQQYTHFYRILGGVLLVGIGIVIGWLIFSRNEVDYVLSLFTNALAIGFGAFVLDERAKQREERRLKEDLIYKMGSRINPEAVRAVEELERKNWLQDGSLKGAYLWRANLRKARLLRADLQDAQLALARLSSANLFQANLSNSSMAYTHLSGANLGGTSLVEASVYAADMSNTKLTSTNLERAYLREVNLQGATLFSTNMQNADLTFANLKGAILHLVNFRGANLTGANLENVVLGEIEFDANSILPDGNKWTQNTTELTRFTNSSHPHFWRSSNPQSPAYRGEAVDAS